MPNEQIKVPLFAASEILTAANMNISAGTGVPVFTNSTTRDSAFGGAGEKVLAEGQLCYLSSTNVVQYYDGAAWATVGPSTASGLTLISANTFSGAVSYSLPTNSFSATYQNYLMLFVISSVHVAGTTLKFRYRTSGTDNSTSNYSSSIIGNAAGATVYQTDSSATSASLTFLSAGSNIAGQVTFEGPNQTARTRHQLSITGVNSAETAMVGWVGGAIFLDTTVFDAITLISSAGNLAGNYLLYGYANA